MKYDGPCREEAAGRIKVQAPSSGHRQMNRLKITCKFAEGRYVTHCRIPSTDHPATRTAITCEVRRSRANGAVRQPGVWLSGCVSPVQRTMGPAWLPAPDVPLKLLGSSGCSRAALRPGKPAGPWRCQNCDALQSAACGMDDLEAIG